MSIQSVMPSNQLILCHLLLLLPSIFPSIRVFSSESVLCIRWPKYWSFSSNESSMNIQDWFPLGLTGLISLQSTGLSRVFSNTTVQKYQFFCVKLSLWSNSHIYTWLLEKPSIQFNSVQSCLTLCNSMDSSTPGLPVHHQLLESTQTHVHWVGDAIQPSHPLTFPPPLAFYLSQHKGLFQWVSSSNEVTKVLEFQLQHQSFQWTPRTDFL